MVGESWEGYVIETLLSVLPPLARPYFYRTSAGAGIDLVVEHDDGTRWAIEIKRSLSARVGRGFHLACADVEPARAFVVHAGDNRYPVLGRRGRDRRACAGRGAARPRLKYVSGSAGAPRPGEAASGLRPRGDAAGP